MPSRTRSPSCVERAVRAVLRAQAHEVGRVSAAAMLVLFGLAASAARAQDQESTANAAQEQDAGGLQEVLVTAERRQARQQDVPISVESYSTEQLARANVQSIADLAGLAPTLNFSQQVGWSQPKLRGIGTTAVGPGIENPIAVYVDGVYYASMAGTNLDFNNIQSVEVINGPQGTLFGRNATGGLIQIHTLTPSQQFGGNFQIGYGNYQTTTGSAYLTGGITDHIAADLAVQFHFQGEGWGRNYYTGTPVNYSNGYNVRSKWLFTPTDDLTVTIAGDWGVTHGRPLNENAPGSIPLGGQPMALAPYSANGVFDPWQETKQGGVAATIDYNLGFAHLTSISAYRGMTFDLGQDGSLTPNVDFAENIPIWEPHHQASEELQLSSTPGNSVTWTAGLYYFFESSRWDPVLLYGNLYYPVTNLTYYVHSVTHSAAAYAQATKEIAPQTDLTLGVRYSWERRKFDISLDTFLFDGSDLGTLTDAGSRDFEKATWRMALDHKFTPDLMAYISYNRGFKSGGFTPDQLQPLQSFAPETLDAYELGMKSEFLHHQLRINPSVYYYNYKNMQVTGYETGLLTIANGAAAHLYGLDLTAEARATQHLTLSVGVGLEKATFASFPNADHTEPTPGGGTTYTLASAAGKLVPYAPEFTADISADYTIPTPSGLFDLNVNATHNGGWYAEADNRLHQPAYNVLNAQLDWTLPNDHFDLALWGKNLTNKVYTVLQYSQFQGDAANYGPPRTYGLTVRAKL